MYVTNPPVRFRNFRYYRGFISRECCNAHGKNFNEDTFLHSYTTLTFYNLVLSRLDQKLCQDDVYSPQYSRVTSGKDMDSRDVKIT